VQFVWEELVNMGCHFSAILKGCARAFINEGDLIKTIIGYYVREIRPRALAEKSVEIFCTSSRTSTTTTAAKAGTTDRDFHYGIYDILYFFMRH